MSYEEAEPAEQPMSMRPWNPDGAMESLQAEVQVMDLNIHDPLQLADGVARLFRENALMAAMSICHMSLHDPSPKVRLEASKVVLAEATKVAAGDADPLTSLVSELYNHMATAGLPKWPGEAQE